MIFIILCAIIYIAKEKLLPCSGNYSFYNPTHNLREFDSVCGLQTSRPAEEGSEKHKGVYPPASCGFYALYDGKADLYSSFYYAESPKALCFRTFCYAASSTSVGALFSFNVSFQFSISLTSPSRFVK